MNLHTRLANALRGLLTRGEIDRSGQFVIIPNDAEQSNASCEITEVRVANDLLTEIDAAGADGKKDYTVVLILPDYACEQYGESFYCSHARGANAHEAVGLVRAECIATSPSTYEDYDAKDLAVVSVFEGVLTDLGPTVE